MGRWDCRCLFVSFWVTLATFEIGRLGNQTQLTVGNRIGRGASLGIAASSGGSADRGKTPLD
jgi:hypothetical protein